MNAVPPQHLRLALNLARFKLFQGPGLLSSAPEMLVGSKYTVSDPVARQKFGNEQLRYQPKEKKSLGPTDKSKARMNDCAHQILETIAAETYTHPARSERHNLVKKERET